MSWLYTFRDFGAFVLQKKKLVLAPILIILLLMALFVLLAEIPALTPFIYAAF